MTAPHAFDGIALSRRRLVAALAVAGALAAARGGAARSDDGAAATAPAEPVRFTSRDGVALAGDIYLPAAGPPAVGVVYVDGGGPTPRKDYLGPLYAPEGVAILTYDKRGVGDSGGVYEGRGSFAAESLHRLAEDAAAAIDALAAHPRLAGRPVGFLGASQAGWIVPDAAAIDSRVAFMALLSGPVCSVSEWLQWRAARGPAGGQGAPADSRRRLAQLRADGSDPDPRTWLAALTIPGLWVFGGRDENIPSELSITHLSELIAAGHASFEHKLYPEGGHIDMGPSEEEAHRFVVDWLLRQAKA